MLKQERHKIFTNARLCTSNKRESRFFDVSWASWTRWMMWGLQGAWGDLRKNWCVHEGRSTGCVSCLLLFDQVAVAVAGGGWRASLLSIYSTEPKLVYLIMRLYDMLPLLLLYLVLVCLFVNGSTLNKGLLLLVHIDYALANKLTNSTTFYWQSDFTECCLLFVHFYWAFWVGFGEIR